ncbi:hypothetical protein [Kurthia massiliensis]|uniref:hypothetical protein n=1 Tax=Kurthia massiliensis TaxID=1033739 RepID=UPI0002887F0C|nr:hypothetical protein [Kurthia massiliensis]
MEKITVEFENCYGIKKMLHEFDFSYDSTKIIYAPNGVMKSSFANTLDDYIKGIPSKDRVNTKLGNKRIIKNELNEDFNPDSIFVIKPFEKSFKTDKISTLLVNQKLKEEYDEIYSGISKEVDELIKRLKKTAGFTSNFVKNLCAAFNKTERDLVKLFIELEEKINEAPNWNLMGIKYNDIFDSKVESFIKSKDFQKYIHDYLKKYEELVNKSKLFEKGFNHNNANVIQKQLKENGYFKANHSVLLKIDDKKVEINNSIDLSNKFLEEENRILQNEDLRNIFEKIDKKLTNKQLREFRDLLLENPSLLIELENLTLLKQKLWITYIAEHSEQYKIIIEKYKNGQERLKDISEKAKKESTKWEEVVSIFNSRFHVPYKVRIENKEDAIVKETTPNIQYYFKDDSVGSNIVEENLLWDILSQGEKRTLYLLNIIFEMESRKEAGVPTLFIIDDIADSFDYKNKYAIIEYLNDISKNPLFKMIILTHNFDFLRTIQSRICKEKHHSTFMAFKEENEITLEPWKYNYINNPLKNWKKYLNEDAKLIASITFARNLAEYIDDKQSVNILTSILHIKATTKDLDIEDLEKIYCDIFKEFKGINRENKKQKVYDLILETTSKIITNGMEKINLEEKIVLSIAIRLLAEEYMISKINDEVFVSQIEKYQTATLYERFKELKNIAESDLDVLDRVIIMTPENIHLNSFMFEPLLDLSNLHLIKLFEDISELKNQLEVSNLT